MVIFIFALILVFLLIFIWLFGLFYTNDLSIKNAKLKCKKVLLIFPHADDEVLNAGGVIHKYTSQDISFTLAILTEGEKGTPDAHLEASLKEIRVKEAQQASKMLGLKALIQEDFGDGELIKKKQQVKEYIDRLIAKEQPDLIITYDLAGLYGHEDHITCAEAITELIQEKYTSIKLWYVSFPQKILAMTTLPEHMAKDPKFKKRRTTPNLKVFVGLSCIAKICTVYAYKSQYESFRSAIPFRFIPLWFIYSMQIFEYFHEVETNEK